MCVCVCVCGAVMLLDARLKLPSLRALHAGLLARCWKIRVEHIGGDVVCMCCVVSSLVFRLHVFLRGCVDVYDSVIRAGRICGPGERGGAYTGMNANHRRGGSGGGALNPS